MMSDDKCISCRAPSEDLLCAKCDAEDDEFHELCVRYYKATGKWPSDGQVTIEQMRKCVASVEAR